MPLVRQPECCLIVIDLQPSVAMGYAAQIMTAYQQLGHPEQAQAMFEEFATHHPRLTISQQDHLKDFPDAHAIVAIAQKARSERPAATIAGQALERNIAGIERIEAQIGPLRTR